MAYDVHVESTRLIEHGAPDLEAQLSRRTRHVPLAVDRDGDVAATMILRRGVGGAPMLDLHLLQLVAGHWQLLGGGGGGFDEALQPRPRRTDLRAPGSAGDGAVQPAAGRTSFATRSGSATPTCTLRKR